MGLLTPARLSPGATLCGDGGVTVAVQSWQGEGSFAQVFRGTLLPSARACAVKVPNPDVPESSARLERERDVLRRLEHPRVGALLGWGAWAGSLWLALEWLEGPTLRDTLAPRKRLSLRQALEVFAAALEGLAHIHGRDLAHGDVREQNVILVPGRGAVLTDPGGEGNAAADVRAAGALFHRMVTGEAPLPGAPRLAASSGYNRGAVQLWERSAGETPPSALELLETARRVLATL